MLAWDIFVCRKIQTKHPKMTSQTDVDKLLNKLTLISKCICDDDTYKFDCPYSVWGKPIKYCTEAIKLYNRMGLSKQIGRAHV